MQLELRTSLQTFFRTAVFGVPDLRYRQALTLWGEEIVFSGLEVIRDELHLLAYGCPDEMAAGPDKDAFSTEKVESGCLHVHSRGSHMMSAFLWALYDVDLKRAESILIMMLKSPDYDIATLAASLLNGQDFHGVSKKNALLEAYKLRRGTAFRLASAITLYVEGELIPLQQIAVPVLLPNLNVLKEKLTDEQRQAKKDEFMATNPESEQVQEFILDGIGSPLSRFFGRTEKLIMWDIATNGYGPCNKWPDWWIRE